MRVLTTLFGIICLSFAGIAQSVLVNDGDSSENKNGIEMEVTADIVSRYVWRGLSIDNAPNIQPSLAFAWNNIELGLWNSVSTVTSYNELDVYLKYTIGGFSFTLADYFVPNDAKGLPLSEDIRFFVFDDETTAHTVEASLMFEGSDNIPLWVSGNVFVYGNDKHWGLDSIKDEKHQTYYSSYLETGYSFLIKRSEADIFVGFTPASGAYGKDLGVINIGFTGYRDILITKHFELPVKASLIFNPQASAYYMVFCITL